MDSNKIKLLIGYSGLILSGIGGIAAATGHPLIGGALDQASEVAKHPDVAAQGIQAVISAITGIFSGIFLHSAKQLGS